MNETVIEAQARYLIEDRIHPTHRTQSTGVRRRHRRHRRLRGLSWL
jgi:hypothetical protein